MEYDKIQLIYTYQKVVQNLNVFNHLKVMYIDSE